MVEERESRWFLASWFVWTMGVCAVVLALLPRDGGRVSTGTLGALTAFLLIGLLVLGFQTVEFLGLSPWTSSTKKTYEVAAHINVEATTLDSRERLLSSHRRRQQVARVIKGKC